MIPERRGSLSRALAPALAMLCLLGWGAPCAASVRGGEAGTWAQAFEPGTLPAFGFFKESAVGPVFAASLLGPMGTTAPVILQEDPEGNVLWQKVYGSWGDGQSFVVRGQGEGYLAGALAGTPDRPLLWLAGLDGAGAVQWQETVSAPPYRGFVDYAFPTKDGWLLRGMVINPLFQSQTPALVKVTPSGDIEWQWTYKDTVTPGGGGDEYAITDVVPLDDGGAAAVGTALSASSGDMNLFVARLGADGRIIWQSMFGGADDELPVSLTATDDGGFLLTATVLHRGDPTPEADSYGAWAIRLSSKGEVVWQTLLQAPGSGMAPTSGMADPQGGFLLSGWTAAFGAGDVDAWAAKLDEGGGVVWQRAYGGPGPDWASVAPDPAGDYLLQGVTASGASSPSDFWLAKLDESGGILWQKLLGGEGDDWASAARLSDGRLLVSGLSPPAFGPDTRAWTMVLDPDGGFGQPCAWLRAASLSSQEGTASAQSLQSQTVKMNLAEYAANFSLALADATVSDAPLAPSDLCPFLAPLTAAAEADVTSGTAPLSVQFTGSASGGAGGYAYAWDFGDGGSSTEQSPSHTYGSPGDYGVTLTVTDSLSQTAVDGHLTVHVVPPGALEAAASADVASGDAPLTVHFTGSASGGTPPYTYAWAFGDGAASSEPSPTHTYATAGIFSALLTVTDGAGHTASAVPLTLTVYGPLTALASADPASGSAPLAVQFTGSASGGSGSYTYAWAFGDGATSTEQSPSHTYAAAGTYAATLAVTDTASHSDTAAPITITVTPGLSAASSADAASGTAPLTVHFSGTASGGTPPYTYAWAFGDGATSTEQNPSHTYAAAGDYAAVLTVTDGAAHTASAPPLVIAVVAPLEAAASADTASGTAPLAVHFSGTASGGTPPYTYAWAFGDGATSTEQNPSHTYAAAGDYAVTLTVTDSASRTAADGHLTIRVTAPVPPPVISLIKKVAPPFTLVATGSNLQNGIRVFINGTEWTNIQWKNAGKVKILGGKSLKAAVPKGAPTTFTFLNPDGGTATVSGWSW